jgi:hypothetical protein
VIFYEIDPVSEPRLHKKGHPHTFVAADNMPKYLRIVPLKNSCFQEIKKLFLSKKLLHQILF